MFSFKFIFNTTVCYMCYNMSNDFLNYLCILDTGLMSNSVSLCDDFDCNTRNKRKFISQHISEKVKIS